ncbi:natural cytotoxicity triggering receptor 3 ligand 1-like isoform X2 [Pyxicephalus adspersus]|uniref:natural cytotoxicity triggering receptor 3 ligand 1-like isoform X2 n=1 Tax=Pyxicephalus adspersus TaxID=30357 RepID=UPI003B5BD53E
MTLQIIDNESLVEALLGQDVTIPCVLADKNMPQKDINLNLSTDSVRWDIRILPGKEHKVYLFTNGISTCYRPNSNVDEKEFIRGIASLTLHNVRKSDEGEYRCVVYVSGNKLQGVRTLQVSARPIVTLSANLITVTLGNEQSVTCYVDKFYPEAVKIQWKKRNAFSESALDRDTCASVPTPADDGTFNVTSKISLKPTSIREDGEEYFCIVKHRSLKNDYSVGFTVSVTKPPTSSVPLSVIIPLLCFLAMALTIILCLLHTKRQPKISDIMVIDDLVYGKSSVLCWMVSYVMPGNIEIHAYLRKGSKKEKICSWKYQSPAQAQNNFAADHSTNAESIEGFRLLDRQIVIQQIKSKRSSSFYNYLCSIKILPDKKCDKDAELVIEVKHIALKPSLTKKHKLDIKETNHTKS